LNGYRAIVVWILVGVAPLLAGCHGSQSWDRLPISGTVVDRSGEKVSGSITFTPLKGQSGPAANMVLKDGSYQFSRSDGPVAGSYTVIVRRVDPRSRTPRSADKVPGAPKKSEWALSAELSEGGPYVRDFELD
jgi:hypothetical protein